MSSALSVERIANCPFSLSVDLAHDIFPELESSRGGVRIGVLRRRVAVRFQRGRDATDVGRLHDEVSFDWNAHSPWLPNFNGTLRFRIESSQTRIILSGGYVPPFGPLGAAFDRVVGNRLALATARDLVHRVARALEARWAEERRSG